ncbi:hypothetical protein IGJ53_002939 [Enterococcus sp. DIV1283b]
MVKIMGKDTGHVYHFYQSKTEIKRLKKMPKQSVKKR